MKKIVLKAIPGGFSLPLGSTGKLFGPKERRKFNHPDIRSRNNIVK
jgi:hypothetical protein